MVDSHSNSKILLTLAAQSFEAGHTAHQNILRAAKKPLASPESLRSDLTAVVNETFRCLTLLRILLFEQGCGSEDGVSLGKTSTIELPTILGKVTSIEPTVIEDKPAQKIGAVKTETKVCTPVKSAQTEIKTTVEKLTPPATMTSQIVARYVPSGLESKIKELRLMIEKKCVEHGISVPVIQAFHEFEKRFSIPRDPTTSFMWNMDHQEQRKLVFDDTTEKIVYREKCECEDDDDEPIEDPESKDHEDDPHCPRNIASHEEQERKRRKDPTTKAKAKQLIDITMDHVGRQNVKDHFLMIRDLVSSRYRRPKPWENLHLGMVLTGPGNTGKFNYARHYARYLIACGVFPDNCVELDAKDMLPRSEPHSTMMRLHEKRGILFLNNAHELASFKTKERSTIDYILKKVAKYEGEVMLILSGREEELNAMMAASEYRHVVPYTLHCPAFKEDEVTKLMSMEMINWFGSEAKVEDGWNGLYMRIAAKRLVTKEKAQNPENPNYGTRVETLIKEIWTRHYRRLNETTKSDESNCDLPGATDNGNPEDKQLPPEHEFEGSATSEDRSGVKTPTDNKQEKSKPLDAEATEVSPQATSSSTSTNADQTPTLSTVEQSADAVPTDPNSPKNTDTASIQPEESPDPPIEIDESPINTEATEKPKKASPAQEESPDPPIDDKSIEIKPSNNQEDKKLPTESPVRKERNLAEDDGTKKPQPKFPVEESIKKSVDSGAVISNNEKTAPALPSAAFTKPNVKFTGPHLFTKDDILGPCPGQKMKEGNSWKKLQTLTGLEEVKKALTHLSELARTNYERELLELPPIDFTFNRLFLGPPGTGKTVVAKLYGEILADMGVLSKGHVVVKNATALVGKYIGWSEAQTTAALEEAKGGVLVIDEAYTLASEDVFRKAIVTTLVGGIQNVPGEDRCVILVGYEDKMRKLIQDANPGLARRFPMEDAFIFKDYSVPELKSIMEGKLEEYKLAASEEGMSVALDVLDKARAKLNFGNGGEVENLITRAKSNCLARLMEIPLEDRPKTWTFDAVDFDPDYKRVESATTKLKALFADVVDCEPIITKFEQYQTVCKAMKARNLDPRPLIPTTFVFKGPPGTGKTTTARKIAQVYYDMGFLSAAEVIECTVTDLIGSYVGQTGPKTIKVLERALGKVFFIDEAYRFAHHGSGGSFANDAISELVDSLTKPKFMGKIIVILAGYEDEMNSLLSMNPGLASRFSEEVIFKLISPAGCLTVLQTKLKEQGIEFPVADQKKGYEFGKLENIMRTLSNMRGWGNARDVETLSKAISRKVFSKMTEGSDSMVCDAALALETMDELLKERQGRNGNSFLESLYN